MFHPRLWTLIVMVLAAATTRVLPHPWNFTAIGAMCLFGGAYFQQRWLAFAVPLAALILSDVAIAYLQYNGDLTSMTSFKYFLFALTVAMGMVLRDRPGIVGVSLAAVAASAMFFLVSNFQVWFMGKLYPLTPEGLWACYLAAIPFAQNMLLGNVFYSGLLFGGFELLQWRLPALRASAMRAAE
jgi:hypothetical protein